MSENLNDARRAAIAARIRTLAVIARRENLAQAYTDDERAWFRSPIRHS